MTEKPDQLLRLQSALSLRRHDGIRNALRWFRENSSELSEMVGEFDSVLSSMRNNIVMVGTEWSKYKHLDSLVDILGDNDLPPSLEWIGNHAQENDGKSPLVEQVKKTFSKVNNLLSNDWAWAGNLNPQQTASGLLIEGYGLMSEDYLQISGFRRKFVEAFEEELILNHKGSPLLKDAIGWMKEEKDGFSPVVQKEIDALD